MLFFKTPQHVFQNFSTLRTKNMPQHPTQNLATSARTPFFSFSFLSSPSFSSSPPFPFFLFSKVAHAWVGCAVPLGLFVGLHACLQRSCFFAGFRQRGRWVPSPPLVLANSHFQETSCSHCTHSLPQPNSKWRGNAQEDHQDEERKPDAKPG